MSSALERTAAYAYTGNAKVLSSGVMGPLFLSRGLVEDGMPVLSKAMYELPLQNVTPLIIHPHTWPLTAGRRRPAICSKKSHILTYSDAHYMVSIFAFQPLRCRGQNRSIRGE